MNVILLVYDSVRPDFLGCYGNKEVNTSVIDDIARMGLKFENVISTAPWTLPSICSIISGIYSHKLGMFSWHQPIDNDVKTIFHYFLANNYRIGSFVFDEKYLFSKMRFTSVKGNSRNFNDILNWIERNKNSKFFLFVHSWRTHIPWEPKNSAQKWRTAVNNLQNKLRNNGEEGVQECRKLYKKAIEYISENQLSQLLDILEKNGILNRTLIILTSDHGESWGERIHDKSKISDNFALHGRFLYDEVLKVPLIFWRPDLFPSGRSIDSCIRNIDIAPTILEACDLNRKKNEKSYKKMDGISLCNMIKDYSTSGDRFAISSTTDVIGRKEFLPFLTKLSLRTSKFKLIWSIREKSDELYDLITDPKEKLNIVKEYPDIAFKMKAILKKELNKIPERRITKKEQRDIEKQLKGLGYL